MYLKHIMLICTLISCFLVSASAQGQEKLPNTLLWKIEGHGLKKPSYLYGTMHVASDRAFRFMDSTLIYFDKADVYAMELNMDSVNMLGLMQEIMLPAGQTLHGMLDSTEYKKLDEVFTKSMGISVKFFDQIRPIYVWMFTQLPADEMSQTKGVVVDVYFDKLAKKENKPVYGLESVDDQLHLLQDIPMDKQVRILKKSLKDPDTTHAAGNEMDIMKSYEEQDLNGICAETAKDTTLGFDFSEKFINQRNVHMANKMEKLMKQGSVFVAVGAGHLPCEKGLINLLRQRGYKVSPVLSKKRLSAEEVKAKVDK